MNIDWDIEKQKIWAQTRSVLENEHLKNKRNGTRTRSYSKFFERMMLNFGVFLKWIGQYDKGHTNALNIQVNKIELQFNNLPSTFENYKILHLSDLHLDSDPELVDSIIKKIKLLEYDLCVITGDYRHKNYGGINGVSKMMKRLIDVIEAKDGVLATLGNHDTYLMVDAFANPKLEFLNNRSVYIKKADQQICITGIDDVHSYYTDQAVVELEEERDGFKIALVHSPELFDVAAENAYRLYLCGHTHGGQVCLPSGKALIKHLYNGKEYVKGLWKYKGMFGYTNTGAGTSGIPVRINSQSELAIFTLLSKNEE